MKQGFLNFCSACLKYKSLNAEYSVIHCTYFNYGFVLIVEETEITTD